MGKKAPCAAGEFFSQEIKTFPKMFRPFKKNTAHAISPKLFNEADTKTLHLQYSRSLYSIIQSAGRKPL
jgi:hypothetical protein